ncbi:hypothetical protein AAIB33_09960 [Microbacterium sp. AZCO]|uniref:hypothetical protein n=1 Tax=Microbacterium sp. AZCO TaxID=3142976 RepID=UPI0031F3C0B0
MRAIVRNEALRQEQGDDVLRLKAQLERVQGRRMDAAVLPTLPAFASLLPAGGLRAGSAYTLSRSASLVLALMARPSQDGAWCAAIGMPELGAEAAESLGVDLARLVFVPDPGPRWLAVTATIAEIAPVVAVRPPGRAADGQVSRLAARLRDRGTVLLVQGQWPQAEATLEVSDPEWSGVGRGHGYLSGRAVTVTASSRRWSRERRERMLLPGPNGEVSLVAPAVAERSGSPRVFAVAEPPGVERPESPRMLAVAEPSGLERPSTGSGTAIQRDETPPTFEEPSDERRRLEVAAEAAGREPFEERLRRAMRVLEAVG